MIVGPGDPGSLHKPTPPPKPDKIALDEKSGRFPKMGHGQRRQSFSGEEEMQEMADRPLQQRYELHDIYRHDLQANML